VAADQKIQHKDLSSYSLFSGKMYYYSC